MTSLQLSRELPVSAAETYAQWTVPERMRQWWWPFFADTSIQLDPRVAGSYVLESKSAGIGARGRYLVVEPDQRLRFTWNWITDGEPEDSSDEVEVRFATIPSGSRVDLVHDLDPRAGDGEPLRQGWSEVLDWLVKVLQPG